VPGAQLNTDADASMVNSLNSDTAAMPGNVLNNLSNSMSDFSQKFGTPPAADPGGPFSGPSAPAGAPGQQVAPGFPPVNSWSAEPPGMGQPAAGQPPMGPGLDPNQPTGGQDPDAAEAAASDFFQAASNDAANQSVRAWSPLGGLNEPDPASGFGSVGYDPVTGSNLAQPGDDPIWHSALGGINEPDPTSGFGARGTDPVTGSNLVQPGDPAIWSSPLGGIQDAGTAAASGSSDATSSRAWNLVV
jgi:hypothetical protein